jgi:hypothetical protein
VRDGMCDRTYQRSNRFRRYESANRPRAQHVPAGVGPRAVLGGQETTPPLRSATLTVAHAAPACISACGPNGHRTSP